MVVESIFPFIQIFFSSITENLLFSVWKKYNKKKLFQINGKQKSIENYLYLAFSRRIALASQHAKTIPLICKSPIIIATQISITALFAIFSFSFITHPF